MYEEDPSSPDAINRYAQLLKKQGTAESRQLAHDLYLKGYEATNEYRFRMQAGDIEIEDLERALEKLNNQFEEKPDDETLKAEWDETRTKLLELKSSEYSERVKLYPTDRFRKFDLGMIEYELGHYDEAMAQFQASKDEPKLRARAGHMLGRCFLAEQWYAEAIAELEETLKSVEATDSERELAIRYDLMLALLAAAQDEQSIDHARQAKSICSDIARRNITYRDIRAKRKEVDEVIKNLSGEG
jgi:tryptophan 2,3-dioxygenase